MVEDIDLVKTDEVIKEVLSNEKEITSHLNDEEIELITEKVMDKITEKLKLLSPFFWKIFRNTGTKKKGYRTVWILRWCKDFWVYSSWSLHRLLDI